MFPSIIFCIVPMQRRTLPRRCKAVWVWLSNIALCSGFGCLLFLAFSQVFLVFFSFLFPYLNGFAVVAFHYLSLSWLKIWVAIKKKKKIFSWLLAAKILGVMTCELFLL